MAPVNELRRRSKGWLTAGRWIWMRRFERRESCCCRWSARVPRGKARVVISPHHGLHLFPFHAASWDGKFLMERCAVRLYPNFSSLLLEWRGQQGTGVFALAVSRFNVAGERFPELANTEEEARAIAGMYAELNLKAEAATERAPHRSVSGPGRRERAERLFGAAPGDTRDQRFCERCAGRAMESKLMLQDGWIDGWNWRHFTCRRTWPC